MGYAAKVLKDSITAKGHRLTTFEVTIPRIVLAEFNTHRMLSRNSASSRAIPVEKRIAMVEKDPFVPDSFGKNQPGMQASFLLAGDDDVAARVDWLEAAASACASARKLAGRGVHKQLANRVLEPFLWHTIIVSATEWGNYFALRRHKDAQPEIRNPTEMMWDAMQASTPDQAEPGYWHRPLLDYEEYIQLYESEGLTEKEINLVSVGRCARVSYLTHDGRRDPKADIELARRLQTSGHMSPFEHIAMARCRYDGHPEFIGNFRGWQQERKLIRNEHDFSLAGAK